MTLRNLLGVSLEQITPDPQTVQRLLEAARRQIADSKITAVSVETRFSSAYTAVRMLADVALHAHGYRTLTSKPGHHQTAIQTLSKTFDIDSGTLIRLDKLRKQRNLAEYTGDSRFRPVRVPGLRGAPQCRRSAMAREAPAASVVDRDFRIVRSMTSEVIAGVTPGFLLWGHGRVICSNTPRDEGGYAAGCGVPGIL